MSSPFSKEAQLKRNLRSALADLGFSADGSGGLTASEADREDIKKIHNQLKSKLDFKAKERLEREWNKFSWIFAQGNNLEVDRIKPCLVKVESGSHEERFFRLGGRCWGMKLSAGYGRRMRYLVWDKYHGKLMGLIGLSDPVFNLKVRDEWIGWNSADRVARLSSMLDAFVLGAIPPYSHLLGGKLVAALLLSSEIGTDFHEKYAKKQGLISGVEKPSRLALITTLSAFGRSSVYNRIKIGDLRIMESLGYTKGWGHFHIDDEAFAGISKYLNEVDPDYFKSYAFGNGPNWRLRIIKRALKLCGMREGIMRHGVKREVFACKRYDNSIEYLGGKAVGLRGPNHIRASKIAEMAMDRWVIPRASRDARYRDWTVGHTQSLIFSQPVPIDLDCVKIA